MDNKRVGYHNCYMFGEPVNIEIKLEYDMSIFSENVMNGETVEVHSQSLLNSLIRDLEKKDHLGIVISGHSPWLVKVIKKEVVELPYCDLLVGKYYKVVSSRDTNYRKYGTREEGSLNGEVIYIESFNNIGTYNIIITKTGKGIGQKYDYDTMLDNFMTHFIEVSEPENIYHGNELECGHYYRCIEPSDFFYNEILFVDVDDSYYLTNRGEDGFTIDDDVRFIEVIPNWSEV